MIRSTLILLAACAFAFAACKHDPQPQPDDTAITDTAPAVDTAVTLTTDATIASAAAVYSFQVQPFDVTDAQPRQFDRVPQPDAQRVIWPHPAYREADHARNASGRFTGADC